MAETQSLRRAADLLAISHGGLFKSLKVLEEELGFELFSREGRGIVLSDKGREFYPKALKFLESFEELISKKTLSNDLRIGTFEVFSTYFLSYVITQEFAERSISLKELVPGELENALLNNEIDFGITYEPIPTQGIDILKITNSTMGIYSGQKFNDNIKNAPFVAPTTSIKSVISGVKGLDGWPDHKVKRNIKYRVELLETALQICSSSKAVGFFPNFLVELYNESRKAKFHLKEL
ncbi:MAG: DNA-binding transcriptional LysR family regulator, partial [Thermoproteota archaeon]